jgi:hypothetical protein
VEAFHDERASDWEKVERLAGMIDRAMIHGRMEAYAAVCRIIKSELDSRDIADRLWELLKAKGHVE